MSMEKSHKIGKVPKALKKYLKAIFFKIKNKHTKKLSFALQISLI